MLRRADTSHTGELRPGLCTLEGPSPVEGWVCGVSWITWPAVCSCFACLPQAGIIESPWTLAVLGVTGLLWVRGNKTLAS